MTGRIALVWITLCGFAVAQPDGSGAAGEQGKVSIRLKLSRQNETVLLGKGSAQSASGQPSVAEAKKVAEKPGVAKLVVVTEFDVTRCLFEDEYGASSRKPPAKLPPDPTSLLLTPSHAEAYKPDAQASDKPDAQAKDKPDAQASDDKPGVPATESVSTGKSHEAPVEIADQLQLSPPSGTTSETLSLQPQSETASSRKAECPGSPESEASEPESQPDDIENAQDEHPYDAPAANSTGSVEHTKPILQQTRQEIELQIGINECLHYFMMHPENVAKRGPWALMHAALPFGVEAEVIAGNRRVNALGWMCYNGVCAKQRIFQPTKTGFRANVGPGVQGHEGQFLAILAQSRVPADYPLIIGNRRYAVSDLVKYEMATCREKSELTFKLIGLSHYLPANQRWRDNRGHTWNLEKMVAEELAQPVVGAACGGTHRLMGLSYAVIKRQKDGMPIDGNWQRAELFLNDYVNYAMSLQNPDGSFSTSWFEGRGRELDVERQVQTTGHILEWLIYTLPDEYLRSPRIQKSVQFLIDSVGRDPSHDWPIGPRGHALRALALYNQRVFGAEVGNMRESVAGALQAPLHR